MDRTDIFVEITKERHYQDHIFGPMPRNLADMIWLSVLVEEVGEVAKAILKRDWDNMKVELVQVAAVAVAWLEDDENHDNGEYPTG